MKTILLVEDEPNIRKFVRLNLSIRRYQVVEMDNAEDALAYLLGEGGAAVSAILLDISLPGMDGWSLLNRLQAEGGDTSAIPVVVISGSLPLNEPSRRHYDNLCAVLDKPVSTQQLLQVVRQVCGEG